MPNPVLGDTPYQFTYSDYKDFGGVKFSTRIAQIQGGFPVNEFTITNVQPNAAVDLAVPANVQSATVAPVRAEGSRIAEGVWFVGGGSHHSVVVEFNNFITVIEGPLGEACRMRYTRSPWGLACSADVVRDDPLPRKGSLPWPN